MSSGSAKRPAKVRLEMIDKIELAFAIPVSVATTEDELYMYCSHYRDIELINVFDRNNLREVKHVIRAEDYDLKPRRIVACDVAKCLYLLCNKGKSLEINSVDKITKDDDGQFHISPWISDLPPKDKEKFIISVAANGNLMLSRTDGSDEVIRIYDMEGDLQQEVRLPLDLFYVTRIIPKSNGNLLFVSLSYDFKKQITETDTDGKILKQFQSSLMARDAEYADIDGRMLIVARDSKMELLDSEFSKLEVTLPKKSDNLWTHPTFLHYDKFRSEVLVMEFSLELGAFLSVFAFKEYK